MAPDDRIAYLDVMDLIPTTKRDLDPVVSRLGTVDDAARVMLFGCSGTAARNLFTGPATLNSLSGKLFCKNLIT